MKNLIYALGATFLIGSSAVSAQSHVRLSTTGEVDVAGVTITAEEQVRENFLDLRPALLPSYAHTQVGVSKEIFEYFTLGAAARNVSESGEVSNRLQLDAGAGVDYEGLFVSTGLSLQEVIGADLSEHSLGPYMRTILSLVSIFYKPRAKLSIPVLVLVILRIAMLLL